MIHIWNSNRQGKLQLRELTSMTVYYNLGRKYSKWWSALVGVQMFLVMVTLLHKSHGHIYYDLIYVLRIVCLLADFLADISQYEINFCHF